MTIQVMFYQANPTGKYGVSELCMIDGNAAFQLLKRYEGFYNNWTQIVQVDSVIDIVTLKPRVDLLFYEKNNGWGHFVSIDDAGTVSELRQYSFQKSWTHIIPVRFEYHTNIMFYNGTTGYCEVYRYVSSRQPSPGYDESKADRGSGNLSLVKSMTIDKDWIHIVPGNFGGNFGGLLFYNKDGTALFSRMGPRGDLTPVKQSSFSKTWTKIIPIPFGFRTDLFFYDAANRIGETYYVNDQGEISLLSRISSMGKNWTHIVPIETGIDLVHPYLFFYDPKGIGELCRINGRGELSILNHKEAYTANWTHILPVRIQLPPPVYRIRLHAIVAGDDPSASGPESTFSAGFPRDEIAKIVNVANLYYREAGIQFEFDPATDIEEIQSILLNYDQPIDKDKKLVFSPKNIPQTPEGRPLHEQGVARFQTAFHYPDKLVIVFRDYREDSSFAGNFSGWDLPYVVKLKSTGTAGNLAHEIGHYLNLWHTHLSELTSMDEAAKLMSDSVESNKEAQDAIRQNKPVPDAIINQAPAVFDGDSEHGVSDTPPDPSQSLFYPAQLAGIIKDWHYDPLPITVTFWKGTPHARTQKYILDPDRWNIMSYFDSPGNCRRFTPSQVDVMRKALESGNRKNLIRHPIQY